MVKAPDLNGINVAGFSGTLPSTMTVLRRNDTVVNKDAVYRFPRHQGGQLITDPDNNTLGVEFPRYWDFMIRGTIGAGIILELSVSSPDSTSWEVLGSNTFIATNVGATLEIDNETYGYLGADNVRIRLRGRSVSSTNPASNIDIEFFATDLAL